jgi:hypothetical protein
MAFSRQASLISILVLVMVLEYEIVVEKLMLMHETVVLALDVLVTAVLNTVVLLNLSLMFVVVQAVLVILVPVMVGVMVEDEVVTITPPRLQLSLGTDGLLSAQVGDHSICRAL